MRDSTNFTTASSLVYWNKTQQLLVLLSSCRSFLPSTLFRILCQDSKPWTEHKVLPPQLLGVAVIVADYRSVWHRKSHCIPSFPNKKWERSSPDSGKARMSVVGVAGRELRTEWFGRRFIHSFEWHYWKSSETPQAILERVGADFYNLLVEFIDAIECLQRGKKWRKKNWKQVSHFFSIQQYDR